MAQVRYGRTWWGARWLQALAQIDHDNRLPRGRTYAGNGSVQDLRIEGSHVRASVQGSRRWPYDVEIHVPSVPAAAAATLVDSLAQDPGLIARLLNRELDPAVLATAERLAIEVFPTRWRDLGMHCSCPDHAVPCKHLAAVVYLLSQQIDADPFLVFSLRGIDLPGLLSSRGLQLETGPQAAVPAAARLLFDDAPAAAPGLPLAQLDFSTLPDLRQTLWRLLPAAPVFHRDGDFRALAEQQIARIARSAESAIASTALADAAGPLPSGSPRITVDDRAAVLLSGVRWADNALSSMAGLLAALGQVAPARVDELPAALAALWQLRLLALHLLAKGAVLPQPMALGLHELRLRWLPAELDDTVRAMVGSAAAGLPAGLVLRRKGRGTEVLLYATQARLALSLMLDALVFGSLADEPAATRQMLQGRAARLFFVGGPVRFDGPGEAGWPGSLHAWLARLHLARQAHAPVLQLEESDSGESFLLSVGVADEAQPLRKPTPLARVMKSAEWQARRMAVLQGIAMLAELYPPLSATLREGAREPLALPLADLPALLFEALPAIRLLGIRVLLPKALDRLLRPRLSLRVRAAKGAGATPSFLDSGQVFSFDWRVAIGDQALTAREFQRLLGRASGVVRFKGEYVYLDPAAVEQLRRHLDRPPGLDGAALLRSALAGSHEGAPVTLDAAAQKLLDRLRRSPGVPLPRQLRARLRPYQARGYEWLVRNARLGLGSVIADDMGLGKTLQVIALLQHLHEQGELQSSRALVIVPTSLLSNWLAEVARFAPGLGVELYHGGRRALKAGLAAPVLLTSYGVARSDAARLKTTAWRIVIVDEAQNLKNPAAAQTKAVKSIDAASHVAMSGTPVENRLADYWSIVDFAQPGYLGGLTQFAREFATPIQADRDAEAAARLQRVLAPLLLRRLKTDKSIIDDLPEKIEQNQHCTLTPVQAALYESVVREGLASVNGESDTFQRQGLVLQMILALKQVCNHPAQYLKQPGTDPLDSGKVARLFDLLDEIEAAREKVLVFTQFREMGHLLQGWLRQRQGREPQFLHGGVPRAQRDLMVQRFQEEPGERVFLLSLKAGGTGLNLTAASHVLHFDLWWNPAVEAQATDRAYRIGQKRNVQVHRLITQGTFEERIDAMMRSKRELAELTVGSGEAWIGQLPPDELRRLFELGELGP